MVVPTEIKQSWQEFRKKHREPLYQPEAQLAVRLWAIASFGMQRTDVADFVDERITWSKKKLYKRIFEQQLPEQHEQVDQKHWRIKDLEAVRESDLPRPLRKKPATVKIVLESLKQLTVTSKTADKTYVNQVNALLEEDENTREAEDIPLPEVVQALPVVKNITPAFVIQPPENVKHGFKKLKFDPQTGVYADSHGKRFVLVTLDKQLMLKNVYSALRYVLVEDPKTPIDGIALSPADLRIVLESSLNKKTVRQTWAEILRRKKFNKEMNLRKRDMRKAYNGKNTEPSLTQELIEFVRNFGVREITVAANGNFYDRRGRIIKQIRLSDGSGRVLIYVSGKYYYADNPGTPVETENLRGKVRDNIIGNLLEPFRNLFRLRSSSTS